MNVIQLGHWNILTENVPRETIYRYGRTIKSENKTADGGRMF